MTSLTITAQAPASRCLHGRSLAWVGEPVQNRLVQCGVGHVGGDDATNRGLAFSHEQRDASVWSAAPRIYWVRRLFVLIVLVVAISILWWCVQKVTGNAGDADPAAQAACHHEHGHSADDGERSEEPEEDPAAAADDDPSETEESTPAESGDQSTEPKKGQKNKKKKGAPRSHRPAPATWPTSV